MSDSARNKVLQISLDKALEANKRLIKEKQALKQRLIDAVEQRTDKIMSHEFPGDTVWCAVKLEQVIELIEKVFSEKYIKMENGSTITFVETDDKDKLRGIGDK